jgi:hypothetical protein
MKALSGAIVLLGAAICFSSAIIAKDSPEKPWAFVLSGIFCVVGLIQMARQDKNQN